MSAITDLIEGRTVARGFLGTARSSPDRVALRWQDDDGTWGEWTWSDLADRVARAAGGLLTGSDAVTASC